MGMVSRTASSGKFVLLGHSEKALKLVYLQIIVSVRINTQYLSKCVKRPVTTFKNTFLPFDVSRLDE